MNRWLQSVSYTSDLYLPHGLDSQICYIWVLILMEKSEKWKQIFHLLDVNYVSRETTTGRFLSGIIVSLPGHHGEQDLEQRSASQVGAYLLWNEGLNHFSDFIRIAWANFPLALCFLILYMCFTIWILASNLGL